MGRCQVSQEAHICEHLAMHVHVDHERAGGVSPESYWRVALATRMPLPTGSAIMSTPVPLPPAVDGGVTKKLLTMRPAPRATAVGAAAPRDVRAATERESLAFGELEVKFWTGGGASETDATSSSSQTSAAVLWLMLRTPQRPSPSPAEALCQPWVRDDGSRGSGSSHCKPPPPAGGGAFRETRT